MRPNANKVAVLGLNGPLTGWKIFLGYVVCTIIGIWPLLLTLGAMIFARLIGYTGEFSAARQVEYSRWGIDFGPALSNLTMAYWLLFFTLGIGVIAAGIWTWYILSR